MLLNQKNIFPKRKKFDLPDAEVFLYENFFTPEESDRLYKSLTETIYWRQDRIKLYGKPMDLPRLTAWYGEPNRSYTYSGISMQPHLWTGDLLYIKSKIEKEAGVKFTNCLLNLYRTGKDSVSWHQDNEKALGREPVIGSVSFGATRPFQLKHISRKDLEKVDIPLTHGSFLLMKGPTQHYWKHRIPKTSRPLQPRINLTFRIIT